MMGEYPCEILLGPDRRIVKVVGEDIDTDSTGSKEQRPVRTLDSDLNLHKFQLKTDEECRYTIESGLADGTSEILKLFVSAETGEAEVESSMLEILRTRQVKSHKVLPTTSVTYTDNPLTQLQYWKLNDEDAYHPVSASFTGLSWKKPTTWTGAVLGHKPLVRDIRPNSYNPPDPLKKSRATLVNILNDEAGTSGVIEAIRFFELSGDRDFQNAMLKYLEDYQSWFELDPDQAGWWETVILHEENQTGTLGIQPKALLLSPYTRSV